MNIDLRRHRYTGISFILHLAVLLGFIAYAGLCPKGAPDANVFYIDIVDGSLFPNGTFANGTGAGGEAQQGAECEKPVSFSEVEKEQPPNDINPDLPLSETEPPDDPGENYGPEDKQVLASSQNQTSGGHPGGMNFGLGSGYSSYILDLWRSRATSTSRNNPWSNQSSYLVVLWRTQLMSMVQKTWKEYSNKTFANNNLRATYRLLISGSGDLLEISLLTSSGDDKYDLSVYLALNNIRSMPQPPSSLVNGRDSVEVTMSFPLSSLKFR